MEAESAQKIPHSPKLEMIYRWGAVRLSFCRLSSRAASPTHDDLSPFLIKRSGRAYSLHCLILNLRKG